MRSHRSASLALCSGIFPVAMIANAPCARSQDVSTPPVSVQQRLGELETQLQQQRQEIDALKQELVRQRDDGLAALRGRGLADMAPPPPSPNNVPGAPVGEAPPDSSAEQQVQVQAQAVPEGQGVLTPAGTLMIDPSVEYVNSASNRLVFRGVELVPGIQIGVIEANRADRNSLLGTMTLRYGITDSLEAELRVPYMYRHDRMDVVQQRDQGIVRTIDLRENDIGDIEFALRYQINHPDHAQEPIFVGSLRVKSDTGKGPFDVGYDNFGIATGLATGSGFWAVEPGVNFLLPSDPVVIYGGVNYLYHIARTINRDVGGALVGRVDPGDAIGANLGFGFALNPRFSFSLGYSHSYIFPTSTEIGGSVQRSDRLQVGQLNFGMSYRLSELHTMNVAFAFGVTADAPNVDIVLRFPFSIKL